MKAQKWIKPPDHMLGMHSTGDLNPAYVTELEAFAEEMALWVQLKWGHIDIGGVNHYCNFCGATIYGTLGAPGGIECNHTDSCPVPRAEQYLKEK